MTVNTSPPDPVYFWDAVRALWRRWRYRHVRVRLDAADLAVLSAGEVDLTAAEHAAFASIVERAR